MKRIFLILWALLAFVAAASAQNTEAQADYLRRYNNLVGRVGPAGLGVETLLDKWEAEFPEDPAQMLARFSFLFTRSRSSQVVELQQDRYLGQAPLISLPDSLGNPHNYYEVYVYDDDLYADALRAIDQAILAEPWRLDCRMVKIDALLAYEKESPEMAVAELKVLADKHFKEKTVWEYEGLGRVNDEQFKAFMQDYCAAIFRIGSPQSAEAFKSLSEYLLGYCKDEPLYVNNLGSYYLVKKEYKTARKYFDQVLRKHPDDMTALKNGLLVARATKDRKLEKKYLEMMAKHGETETDRKSAQMRLDAYNKK